MGNMKFINQVIGYFMFVLLLTAVLGSCATISELMVNYRLPPQSEALKGARVFLRVEDERSTKEILGEGARKEFQHFSGNISFSMARFGEDSFMIGIFDVPSLMKEAFQQRLENLGAEVVSKESNGSVHMVIVLKAFILDLLGNQWKVTMDYEVSLIKEERYLSKQKISGQGERLKILGRRQADIIMGEIFTDTLNRMDIKRLFTQAGL
jgi:hypothetical protein